MYSEIFKMELFMGVNFCSQESSSGPDSFLEPETTKMVERSVML